MTGRNKLADNRHGNHFVPPLRMLRRKQACMEKPISSVTGRQPTIAASAPFLTCCNGASSGDAGFARKKAKR
jgi:hypothetical protein